MTICQPANSFLLCRKKENVPAQTVEEFSRSEALRELKSKWLSCVGVLHLPEDVLSVADLVLQILLKRMFQNDIKELTVAPAQTQSPAEKLTPRDENVVRYMAGYVLHQLKKKYPQHSGYFSDILADGTLDFHVQTLKTTAMCG